MTAADTIRLALYEAPAAACRSLALGHTSLRSGSQRWCWQSEDETHTRCDGQNKPGRHHI